MVRILQLQIRTNFQPNLHKDKEFQRTVQKRNTGAKDERELYDCQYPPQCAPLHQDSQGN